MDTFAIQRFLDTSSLYFIQEEAVEPAESGRRRLRTVTPRVFSFLEDAIKHRAHLKAEPPSRSERPTRGRIRVGRPVSRARVAVPPHVPEVQHGTQKIRSVSKRLVLGLMVATAVAFAVVGGEAFAADPSLHQVYATAEAGKTAEALSMMDTVLRDHPTSAKAHYVEAELLAKAGRLANARTELSTAENLAPGLPFAKPQAVQELQAHLTAPTPTASPAPLAASPANVGGGFPSDGAILVVGGLLALLFFGARALIRRTATPAIPGGGGSARFGGGMSMGTGAQPYAPAGVPPMASPPGSSGIGSGILGGLATGVAVGAGMAAGEALAHNLMSGGHRSPPAAPLSDTSWDAPPNDMGGTDFGIADGGSWDDSGGLGGDDW